jgi:hypothetical protein
MMGASPFAGIAWQVLHHLEGFNRLGLDVYYVEDTEMWPYDPERNAITADSTHAVNYIASMMKWCGLPDRWAYRAASEGGRVYGLSDAQFTRVMADAQVLVNLTASTLLRERHLRVPIRVYLETDPVLPQIEIARGNPVAIRALNSHTHHFTYGENFGAPDCRVPLGPFKYTPTRAPIVTEWWQPRRDAVAPAGPAADFTTIASWAQKGKDFEWEGELYTWSKHHEFLKFLDLPRRTPQTLELALARVPADTRERLISHGWRVRDALSLSRDIGPYRDFITASRGEFTVAKDQNIRLRSGWFSDRSACYLAAGRPVVTQDTGFGNVLPTGEGLFAFSTTDQILAAFEAIRSDYDRHSRAARGIALEYFRAETVLKKLLSRLGF